MTRASTQHVVLERVLPGTPHHMWLHSGSHTIAGLETEKPYLFSRF